MLTTDFLIKMQTYMMYLLVLSPRDEGIDMYEVDSESKDAEASIFHA